MNALLKEELSRISYLTKYDLSKTYYGNLIEQSVIGAPNYGMIDPVEGRKVTTELLDDPHKVLTALSIGFTILGVITTPVGLGPIFFGLGVAADVADAALYYKDGDSHMGTIMMALAVIPGGEFIRATKNTIPLGPFKSLIKKAKDGLSNLTPTQVKQLKKYLDNFTKYADEIGQVFTYQTANKLIKKLPNLLVKIPTATSLYIGLFILKSVKFLTTLTLKIGGTVIAADAVYYYFAGNTRERKANIKKVKQVYDLIKKYYNGDTKKAEIDLNKQIMQELQNPKLQEEFTKQFSEESNMKELIEKLKNNRTDTTSIGVDTTSIK